MAKYIVKANIKHDGKRYAKGDEIEISQKLAKPLIKDGVLAAPGEEVQADEPEVETPAAPTTDENNGGGNDDDDKDDDEETGEEYTGELGKYKIVGEVEYTDTKGVAQGKLEVGSVQEVPVAIGDEWVSKGLAEKFVEGDDANKNDADGKGGNAGGDNL